ncbi:MAG: cysteine rich repeat-containing protein [Bradyrhizobium sp.]
MPRLGFVVLAIAVGSVTAASAQTLTAEQRTACKADFERFCAGTKPGGGRIIACLNKQRAQISEACRNVVDAQKK